MAHLPAPPPTSGSIAAPSDPDASAAGTVHAGEPAPAERRLRPDGSAASGGAGPRDPAVRVRGLVKAYQDPKHPAVQELRFDVERGEVVALLGPSGCGKTTLLRLIAGFERPDAGEVEIGGRLVAGRSAWVQPERRRVGFVFQDYALFPHLDVLRNVAFGLAGRSRAEREARAREVLDLVGLTIFQHRYPAQLSGGQQQRVALARALAPEPDVILLDEPFSNLDAALRGSTREEVRRILDRTGTTALLVTHDQEEAMTFADRLVVMRAGRLEQEGAPEEVYHRPRTAFVASFLGTTNLVRGTARGGAADTPLGRLAVDTALGPVPDGPVLLSVRPEDLAFGPVGAEGVPVRIERREFKGHDLTFACRLAGVEGDAGLLTVQTGPRCPLREGDRAALRVGGRAVALEGSSRPAPAGSGPA